MAELDVHLLITIITYFVISIIIILYLIEYFKTRERNYGLVAVAFIFFFLADNVDKLTPGLSGEGEGSLFRMMILISIFHIFMFIGSITLIFAFYQNRKFNQITINEWQLGAVILLTIAVTIAFMWDANAFFPMPILEFNIELFMIVSLRSAISIPLLFILTVIALSYPKTKNTDAFWILIGFFCLFLSLSTAGYESLNLFESMPGYETHYSDNQLFSALELFAYILFLMVMVKTKMMKNGNEPRRMDL